MSKAKTSAEIARRIVWIIDAATDRAKRLGNRDAEWRMQDIQFTTKGYAEPGYSGEVVVFGNWNDTTRWQQAPRKGDELPSKVGNLFEKLGAEIEWSDEWATCYRCGKAVRTQPDSYSWTRSYTIDDDGITCCDCVEEDPESYLESLEGRSDTCSTFINPASYGYVQWNGGFETGFHPGQNDDPRRVAKEIEAAGITRYLFYMNSVGQFDANWSAWVHDNEADLIPEDKQHDE